MSWVFGSYTGNGATGISGAVVQRVPTPGFTPVWVILFNNAVGSFWKTDTFAATAARNLTATATNLTQIVNLASGSFGVGTNANTLNVVYYYAACDSTDCATGSYTGNGTTQSITGLAFSPGMVMIHATGQTAVWKPRNNGTGTLPFNTSGQFANGLTVIDNGFTVGSADQVNKNGQTIHYAAFRDMPGQQEIVYWQGDATDDRLITIGWSPLLAMIKTEAAGASKSSAISVWRNYVMPKQNAGVPAFATSSFWSDGTGVANRLQDFSDTGLHLGIGGQSEVNVANFNYWAWCVGYPQASIASPATTVTRQASVV